MKKQVTRRDFLKDVAVGAGGVILSGATLGSRGTSSPLVVEYLQGYTERLDQLEVEYSVNHIPDFSISQVFCLDPCGNGVEANLAQDTQP